MPSLEPIRLAPAAADDVHDIWLLRKQLEDWIAGQGIDQWRPGEVPEAVVAEQVSQGQWHVLRQNATLTAGLRVLWSDPDFWRETTDSIFVHGLMVDRGHASAGLGAALLDWAGNLGFSRSATWLRLDCAASNPHLCDYYEAQDFKRVETKALAGRLFDVVLWQRRTKAL